MTKDVILSLKGMQYIQGEGTPEPVEVVTPARYYKKNGKHYLVFEERVEGFKQATQNVLQFTDGRLSVHRRGLINSEMLFEEGKQTNSSYATPLGVMDLSIAATGFSLKEDTDEIDYKVAYALMADQFSADCQISMKIQAKNGGELHLDE